MHIEYIPYGTEKEVQGYDIFIDGEWFGSKRTLEYAKEYADFIVHYDEIQVQRQFFEGLKQQEKIIQKQQHLKSIRKQAKDCSLAEKIIEELFDANPDKVTQINVKPQLITGLSVKFFNKPKNINL